MRDKDKTIATIADKSKCTTITYIDEDGYPVCKEMLAPRVREGSQVFYFTTNTSSHKVQQYLANHKASIYFVDRRFFRGINLVGEMEVLQDKESRELIWREGDTMYYPKGIDDPDYCVLKFSAHRGTYYANFKTQYFTFD